MGLKPISAFGAAAIVLLAGLAGAPAHAAQAMRTTQCHADRSVRSAAVPIAPGVPLQLLAAERDWTLVRAEGAAPCWARAADIAQDSSDVRAVTRYSAVSAPAGRVRLDPAAPAGKQSDCACSTGRTCVGPAKNRYCISRGVLTTRSR